MKQGTSSPLPRDLPGYQESVRLGLAPPPAPAFPPPIKRGPSSDDAARSLGAFGVFILIALAVILIARQIGGGAAHIVQVGTAVAGVIAALVWLPRASSHLRNRPLREVFDGYVTVRDSNFRDLDGRYDAVWQLNARTGEVVRAPNRDADPPGFYLVSEDDDEAQFWSGRMWVNKSRPRPTASPA